MYGLNYITNGLTLGRVLSGISRGLTIANQVIPLYQQAKPMISNARKVMSVLKEFKNTPITSSTSSSDNNISTKKEANYITSSNNSLNKPESMPVFFQ